VGMPLHVAFLRGVGGPKPTPGGELRRAFAAAGYDPVVPVIATGNVVFGLGRKRKVPAPAALATMLERHFGYALPVVPRSGPDILAMTAGDVFRGIDTARQTRFVAMLADGAPDARGVPEPSAGAGYALIDRRGANLFFTIDTDRIAASRVMAILDRTFLKRVTTRNFSTIERVATVLAGG